MKNAYSTNPDKRNLQLEAKAHVTVQQWIDEGGLQGWSASTDGICEIHKRFGDLLPEELPWVDEPATGDRILGKTGLTPLSGLRTGEKSSPTIENQSQCGGTRGA